MTFASVPLTQSADNITVQQAAPLHTHITETIREMLVNLETGKSSNVYRDFLEQVEVPLLRSVMVFTKSNQVRAAKLLGISRGTLRTKLKKYFGNEFCETRGEEAA